MLYDLLDHVGRFPLEVLEHVLYVNQILLSLVVMALIVMEQNVLLPELRQCVMHVEVSGLVKGRRLSCVFIGGEGRHFEKLILGRLSLLFVLNHIRSFSRLNEVYVEEDRLLAVKI